MNIDLSKKYLYRWFHGQLLTDEQTQAFLSFLEWKPLHDPILKGQALTASRKRIAVHYSEDEASEAASLFLTSEMEPWREKYKRDYAALTEEELWMKFNSFYLTFLIKHNPASEVCYAAESTHPDGREKRFEEYPAPDAAEPPEDPEFVPMACSWLLEAGWEWQAVRMLFERVADGGISTALAFELFIRIIERAERQPTRRERVDAFARDMLRRHATTKTKLAEALGLSVDQVRRAEQRGSTIHSVDDIARAEQELETLIIELRREVDRFDPALLS